jgi:rhamnogalacturonyl hydrolase YesR
MAYFHEQESIYRSSAGRAEAALTSVASRFIGAHPKHPPVYRTFCKDGFLRLHDCRYDMNVGERFPEMENGQFIYAWGRLWRDDEGDLAFSVSCYGPVRIFVNGERKFQSNLNDDVFPGSRAGFRARLRKGWNHFVLEFLKTGTGCGGKFGTGSLKGAPLHFLAPSAERNGQEGWIHSEPQSARWTNLETLGDAMSEAATGKRWLPELDWTDEQQQAGCFARVFGSDVSAGKLAFAWAKLEQTGSAQSEATLKGSYTGECVFYLNSEEVYRTSGQAGSFEFPLRLSFGSHDVVVRSTSPAALSGAAAGWGFTFTPFSDEQLRWRQPYPVEGMDGVWLYVGPFSPGQTDLSAADVTRTDTVFGAGSEATFWRVDRPNMWVRPYLENAMFGKWNYPLGVTLYGILETGKELGIPQLVDYAVDHIEQCTSLDAYSLWDMEQYGAPGVNHQLAMIDSLDDCGSFGAAMLTAGKLQELRGARGVADRIAHYISHVQDRQPDGALYRVRGTTDFMKDTVWCDDLYMSVPFLCRYFELTGDASYLDDAAKQFLLYRKRMFMPDRQIMHHVYDYKFDKPNGVPWGRGNGWVLFSLTELLAVMPQSHERYGEIVSFFRELCEGYLRLQDENGMWHQVLTDHESYEEASCTSMFLYAFSRGVRFGWLSDAQPYVDAVLRGWDGLTRRCIDKQGHVYGVCRGSGYSHSALYYKDQLSWQLDDTHGIGIVLLAGIESLRLRRHLAAQKGRQG